MNKYLIIPALILSLTAAAVIGPFPGGSSSSSGGGGGGGSGTVTSVGMTVPSFLSVSGSPITSSGTLGVTLSGTALPIANGGTGETTAQAAIDALLPSQGGNNGEFLTTNGSTASWAAVSASPAGSNTQVQFNNSSSFGGAVGITYASATQSTTFTPTGAPTYGVTAVGAGMSGNTGVVGGSDTYGSSGTKRGFDFNATGGSGSGGGIGYRYQIFGGSTTSGQYRGFYAEMLGAVSSQTLSPTATSGSFGSYVFGNTGGITTGGIYGYAAELNGGNVQIGYNANINSSVGASAKSYGVRATVQRTTGSGTAEAVGGYFKINTSNTESSTLGTSAGLAADNGDTTSPIFLGMDNGSSVMQIQDGGSVILGANAGTATHVLNGTLAGGRIATGVVTLSDGASVALDASLGNTFNLVAAGDRTILAPSNPRNGQRIIINHTASGGSRTLTLTTGSAGAFVYGTTVTVLPATSSGTTDVIGCVYDATQNRWRVVALAQGF